MKQAYQEGTTVKKGDLLFEIDPRPFKAALDQAMAQLAMAKAKLGKTELDVKRYTPLAREKAISQQELDDAVQANLAAKGGVQSAEAAVEQARLNLDFTRIVSPIDGIAGTAIVQLGDLVGPSTTSELTTVSTVNPIKVNFPISEQEYMDFVQSRERTGRRQSKGSDMVLELILADGSVFPQPGKLSYADRQVDVKTGTIRVAALFPNPGDILRPGQYARVRALTETRQNALLVPQRSVTELQGGFQVAVVGPDNKVAIRNVKAGERVGSLWVIDEGSEARRSGRDGRRSEGAGRPGGHSEGGCCRASARPRNVAIFRNETCSCPSRQERVACHGQILHQSSHRGHGDLHPHGHHRPRGDVGAAHRAVSQHRPAGNPGQNHLHRRRRGHRRTVRGHAHRAADVAAWTT